MQESRNSTSSKDYHTIEERRSFERRSDIKHSYFAGGIVAMTNVSRAHLMIAENVAERLRNQLDEKPRKKYFDVSLLPSGHKPRWICSSFDSKAGLAR